MMSSLGPTGRIWALAGRTWAGLGLPRVGTRLRHVSGCIWVEPVVLVYGSWLMVVQRSVCCGSGCIFCEPSPSPLCLPLAHVDRVQRVEAVGQGCTHTVDRGLGHEVPLVSVSVHQVTAHGPVFVFPFLLCFGLTVARLTDDGEPGRYGSPKARRTN